MAGQDGLFPPIAPYEMDFSVYSALNRCAWQVDPSQAVLLIYDMQRWYVERYADPARLVDNINRLRAVADASGMPTIFAAADPVHHLAERGIARDLWGEGIGHAGDATSNDHDMHPDLMPNPDDFIIRKRKYSAFFETDLEALLRRMNRSQIVLCGNYANHGCMTTTVDAYMRNFKVFFTADALGAFDAASHDMALRWVADVCGQVALTDWVVNQIR
jgi:bifunctional isochorismate lyase/aryl carrier protein